MSNPNITFKFAEGQLVKLQEDRPEEAHVLTDVPTEFLSEFCAWDDSNGDYADLAHRDLLKIALDWYQDDLCEELRAYCDAYGLPQMSADELVLQIGGTNDSSNQHVRWLSDFSDRWDEMTDLYHVVQRG